MRYPFKCALWVTLLASAGAVAQVPTGAPKESTALCKDGTFYTGNDQQQACRRNGGVQEWWGKVVAPADVPDAAEIKDREKAEAAKPKK